MFVHIADARRERAIRRGGIRGQRCVLRGRDGVDVVLDRAVYCMPVLPNYYSSHQWLRELKRGGARELVGVYFRVHSSRLVWAGHYNAAHARVTAAEAARIIMDAPDPRGFEVIVPASIPVTGVHDVREVSRVVGWRYYPDAHGKKPCACGFCTWGTRGHQRLMERARKRRSVEGLIAPAN
jgi:hypothetical protein